MFESIELSEVVLSILLKLLAVAVTLIIGRALAGLSRRWLTRSLQKAGLTPSLNTLLVTLVYYSILLVAVMVALAVLGVPTTTIVAAAGLIVVVLAISLQQSLGNLAATINFLLFKPFEVGDIVETSGKLGIVSEIQMFSTVLDSPDNKIHILPNAKIQGAGVTNYSKKGSIRVELSYRISYQSDVERAKQVLEDLLTGDSRVLTEPNPLVFVRQLAESHMELVAWAFVPIANFLGFQKDIAEGVKRGFDEAGVIIPRSQQEIHLVNDQE